MFQVHTFYEAVGLMISAQTDQVAQEHLIERYMLLPNQVWDGIINQATQNVEVLKDPEAVKQLGNILKTNVRACKALGHPYVVQVKTVHNARCRKLPFALDCSCWKYPVQLTVKCLMASIYTLFPLAQCSFHKCERIQDYE